MLSWPTALAANALVAIAVVRVKIVSGIRALFGQEAIEFLQKLHELLLVLLNLNQ